MSLHDTKTEYDLTSVPPLDEDFSLEEILAEYGSSRGQKILREAEEPAPAAPKPAPRPEPEPVPAEPVASEPPAAAPETGDQVHALFRVMQIAAEQYFGKPAVKAEEKE